VQRAIDEWQRDRARLAARAADQPRDHLLGVLARIDLALREFVARAPQPGLLSGYGGAALFYAYSHLWTRNDLHLEQLHGVVGRTLEALEAEPPGLSHAGGLAGIAWCLQHLVRLGLIEGDGAGGAGGDGDGGGVFDQIDDLLAAELDRALAAGQYDFLHEGLGIALYFIERLPDPRARAVLERAVTGLEATASRDEGRGGQRRDDIDAIRWRDHFTRRARDGHDGPCYNLGLAHGSSAIVAILASLHDHGVATERVATLLRGATQWLRSTRLPADGDCVSLYPILVDADNRPLGPTPSRLGWCYGDLAVATALGRAGASLGDRACSDEAHAILRHTVAQRTASNGAIMDAALCHGSMGVSHMLRRAHHATGDDALRAGADHWLAHTLQLGAGPGSAAGFRCWRDDTYVDAFDLLQGITGIGLGLLAVLDPDTAPAWDRCLLLS
jgi:hypothetical protein